MIKLAKNNPIIKDIKELQKKTVNDLVYVDDLSSIKTIEGTNNVIDTFIYCDELQYHDDTKKLIDALIKKAHHSYTISKQTYEYLRQKENTAGLICTVLFKNHILDDFKNKEFIVVCDRLEIPGNIGTIYRTMDATKEEIAKMFLDTGFSRLPVYEEDIDHIIGIVNQKDFHNFIYHTDRPLKDIIRPVLFITPTMKIGVLLKKLQDSKTHIAIILDEFGGTEGLVTIEDIIEELVGDIWDEHDRVIKEIEKISDREYLMSGSANIDKVFELLDIEKAVDVNTLSGWIMEELGQIPKEGDSFVSDGVKVVVLKMDDHRVDKAKVYQNVQNNAENEGNQEK